MRSPWRNVTLALLLTPVLAAQSGPAAPPLIETLGTPVRCHRTAVQACAFAADGRLAATVAGGEVRLWDVARGDLRWRISAGIEVHSLAFGADGATLRGVGQGAVRTWDVRTGAPVADAPLPGGVTHPAPGGGGAALLAEPEAIQLFDRAGSPGARVPLPPARFERLEWSADGRRIVAVSTRQPWVFAWDVPASRPCLDERMLFRPTGVAFAPDGQTLAVCKQGWVELRALDGGRPMRRVLVDGTAWRATFAPDGRSLVVGTADGRVQWRDLADGRHLLDGHEHRAEVTALAVSPDGQLALSGGQDGCVRFWSLAQGKEALAAYGHNNQITALAFSPDGRHVLSGAWNGTLQLWDLATGAVVLRMAHPPHVRGVGFLADGNLVSAGADNTLRVWGFRDGRELRRLAGPKGTHEILGLSLDRTGTRLVTSHDNGAAAVWHWQRGLLQTIDEADGAVVSSDGQHVVAGGRRLCAWTVDPPARRGDSVMEPTSRVTFLDQDHVVCLQSGMLATWELGQQKAQIRVAAPGLSHALAASEPARCVAVAGADAVRLYAEDWEEMATIPAVAAAPSVLAWSADGRLLAVGWGHAVVGIYRIGR